MPGEARAGIGVLAAVVAAVILWLALGPEARHDGVTRGAAERRMAGAIASNRARRAVCRPRDGHWICALTLPDGRVVRTTTDPAAPAVAIAFFTSDR